MKRAAQRNHRGRVARGDHEKEVEEQDIGARTVAEIIFGQINTTIVIGIFIAYPLLVIPIYRSPSTTDWARFVIVCLIHPILQELVMTFQRLNPSYGPGNLELALNDPKRHYFAMSAMNSAFLLEQIFVMVRRAMMMGIQDPTAIVLAIVCTALEEAILRSTMVMRDIFFRRLLGKPEMSDAELLYLRRTW